MFVAVRNKTFCSFSLPTESVTHGGDGASVQVQGVCEVRQHHGQVRAPVTPLLLSTALCGKKYEIYKVEKIFFRIIVKKAERKQWLQWLTRASSLTSAGTLSVEGH